MKVSDNFLLLSLMFCAFFQRIQAQPSDTTNITFQLDIVQKKILLNDIEIPEQITIAFFDSILSYPRVEVEITGIATHKKYYYTDHGFYLTENPKNQEIVSISLVIDIGEDYGFEYEVMKIRQYLNKNFTGTFKIDNLIIKNEKDIEKFHELELCTAKAFQNKRVIACKNKLGCFLLLDQRNHKLGLIVFQLI